MRKRKLLLLLSVALVLSLCLNDWQSVYADELQNTSEQKSYVVVLDPGHGGTDGGASRTYDGTAVNEKDLNLKIAQACKKELETYSNVTVYMTRNSDNHLYSSYVVEELQARADYANEVGADLYVSLHINAASGASHGALVLIPVITENPYGHSFHYEMESLGGGILNQLQGLGLTNNGTQARYFDLDDNRDYYAVIRHCKEYDIPAVIVEHAFLDNDNDYYEFLSSDSQLAALGRADAVGIAQYLGLSKKGALNIKKKMNFSNQWQLINGAWYHSNASGYIQTGWLNLNGIWYYLADNGVMQTGWQYINGAWYYLNSNGAMATGWQYIHGAWYYMYDNGAMATGWVYASDGKWYYLTGSGAMAHSEYYEGYWLNANGSWTYPYVSTWKLTNGRWWYGDDTGWYAKNETLRIDGKLYNFDVEGYLE